MYPSYLKTFLSSSSICIVEYIAIEPWIAQIFLHLHQALPQGFLCFDE